MPQNNENKNESKKKMIIMAAVVLIVLAATFLYRQSIMDEHPGEAALETDTGASVAVQQQAKEFINHQEVLAPEIIQGKPVSGPVNRRPDFVSEFEWQVLKNVARLQTEQNEKQLTDLVNKLLFNKKMEAWLASADHFDRRRELARQLLEMIPEQLANENLDSETAKELEAKLAAEPAKTK